MNNIEIPILKNNNLQSMFVSANHKLVDKHKGKFTGNASENINLLIQLWKEEYNATLDLENKKIAFESSKDRTIFFLKWN